MSEDKNDTQMGIHSKQKIVTDDKIKTQDLSSSLYDMRQLSPD